MVSLGWPHAHCQVGNYGITGLATCTLSGGLLWYHWVGHMHTVRRLSLEQVKTGNGAQYSQSSVAHSVHPPINSNFGVF